MVKEYVYIILKTFILSSRFVEILSTVSRAMNNCISDWNFEGDLPIIGQKNPTGADHDLVELLWRNGQVVLHSQTHRKQIALNNSDPNEPRQVHKHDHDQDQPGACGSYGNSINMSQDDETVSWIHYPLEDSFEKEFCSNLFSDLPSCDPINIDEPIMRQFEEEKVSKFGASDATTHVKVVKSSYHENQMPPPRQHCYSATQNHSIGPLGKVINFSQFSGPEKCDLRPSGGQGEGRECSVMTVGLSHCGSNQLPNDHDMIRKIMPQSESGKTETLEQTVTSSSGGSGSSFGRTCKQSTTTSGNTSNKRKSRDAEELECQSKADELESAAANKSSQRSGTSRKSRAAEVHNLSERRRRDRINEKMKALQELIPHSNKTDKASMLDEAIEYLKSLQLQLQVMWMGSGMAPMMFPGVQHYMSRLGMALAAPPVLPSLPNPMHFPRVPVADQSMLVASTTDQSVLCQAPAFNPLNYQNQMQNTSFSEQYARYMGLHPMQTVSQPVNIFRFSPQTIQQSQSIAQHGISNGPSNSGVPPDGGLSGKMG